MNRYLAVIISGVIAMACAHAPVHAQQRTSGMLRFDRAIILDASGFEQPMAASTMFIPHGWQTTGGVEWGNEHACTNGYNFNWMAVSPDGSSSITVLPQFKWEANNYRAPPSTPGCSFAPYTNVQAYLQAVVQRWRPGARILDFRRRADLESRMAQLNVSQPTAMGDLRTWVEGGEMLFAFEQQGRDMRGSVSALVIFSVSRTNAGSGMGVMEALNAMALPAYGVIAPNGQLNLAFYEALRQTIKTNPQWEQRLSNHNLAIARVAREEGAKRAAIIAKSNDEISRIREQAWNSYNESSDRRAREFGELIRGVETYSDANAPGGTVELSHYYDNAWRLNDGSYVLSNDVNFDPGRDLGVDGQRLEAVK